MALDPVVVWSRNIVKEKDYYPHFTEGTEHK